MRCLRTPMNACVSLPCECVSIHVAQPKHTAVSGLSCRVSMSDADPDATIVFCSHDQHDLLDDPQVMATTSLSFVTSYIGFVMINYYLTKQWPYRIMDDRMKDVAGIIKFFATQTSVFYVFLIGVIAVEYLFLLP